MIGQGPFVNAQREIIVVAAMRHDITAGIERGPRRAKYRGIAKRVGETYALGGERVDMGRVERRQASAAKIIRAQLVSHDEQNVFNGCHGRFLARLSGCRDHNMSTAR